jgi:hypothetical protein
LKMNNGQGRLLTILGLTTTLALGVLSAARAKVTHLMRANVSASGEQANGPSTGAKISGDGRFVAFTSSASNLVPNDTNGQIDVFVRELATNHIARASIGVGGEEPNGGSANASISGDGRFVAFESGASNLVTDDVNDKADIFVVELATGRIRLASSTESGEQGNDDSLRPILDWNGEQVAFTTAATNLLPKTALFGAVVKDLRTGQLDPLTTGTHQDAFVQAMSADGLIAVFDTIPFGEAFVVDRVARTRFQISNGTWEGSETGGISADGRYITYHSRMTNGEEDWGEHWLYDRVARTRFLLGSHGTEGNHASLSGDGRDISYTFRGQIVKLDRELHSQQEVSRTPEEVLGNARSEYSSTSAEGTKIAFQSKATNLVALDTNGVEDIFVVTVNHAAPVEAPGNLTAPALTSRSIQLAWNDNSPDEDGFRVERRIQSSGDWASRTTPSNTTSYVWEGLAPQTTYNFRVFALKQGGNSYPSNQVRVTTLQAGPEGVRALAVSSQRVDLHWVDRYPGDTGFEVWAAVDGAEPVLAGTTKSNASYFRHSGFTGSHTVVYRVRAVLGGTLTDFSAPATAYVLAQPLNLSSRALNSRLIRVAWDDHATNEQVYELWRGVNGGPLALFHTAPANIPYYTDTVSANGAFTYQVRCRRGVHVSSFTNLDTSPALLAPSGLTATAVGSGQVDLAWTDQSGTFETAFHVLRRQGSSAFKVVGVVGAGVTTFSDSSVAGGQTYVYRVRAASGNDWSDHSASAKITTP